MPRPLLPLLRHYLGARRRFLGLRGPELERFQDRRARKMVEYARARSAFYREHFAAYPRVPWRELPEVDKHLMMQRFDEYNTVGITREEATAVALRAEEERDFSPTLKGLTVGLSSGTSGNRGLFLVSPAEQAAWAGTVLARVLPALRPRGFRVAFFLRSDSNLYASLRGRWIDFRYYDLMLPLDQAVRALNDFLPNILAGPPSLLGFLADAAERGELRIRPEKVISFAEVLEPQDRERLEQTFDQPLHQVYQCTEGLLAVTCPLGALHVQEDMVALQAGPLPGDPDRFTPVITDLWRRVQPMLRHRMNDVVAFDAGACKCGSAFRVLSRIEGRCDDVCYFDVDEGGVRPVFPDTVRRMVLLAAPEIRDYQVFQEGVGRLRIHLEPEPEADFGALERAVRESVARTLARYNCHARDLRIERGLEPVPARSKRRRVQRIG